MYEELIGARSRPVRNVVEAGAVKRFAQAIGDLNPLYLDEEYAARSRWGRRIAPPTFPRTFDYGIIEEIRLPSAGMIHGEQQYDYTRPLFVGEELLCHARFVETYRKSGKNGVMIFLIFERVGVDESGVEVVRAREMAIMTETVAAGVGS